MFIQTDIKDDITGQVVSFRQEGLAVIHADIADEVLKIAPKVGKMKTWTNEQFKTQTYKAIREAGYYTESQFDAEHGRRFRLVILPKITDENRESVRVARRCSFLV